MGECDAVSHNDPLYGRVACPTSTTWRTFLLHVRDDICSDGGGRPDRSVTRRCCTSLQERKLCARGITVKPEGYDAVDRITVARGRCGLAIGSLDG